MKEENTLEKYIERLKGKKDYEKLVNKLKGEKSKSEKSEDAGEE